MSHQLHSGVPFLQVDRLRKHFVLGGGFLSGAVRTVQAVSEISFEVEEGTTLGIVGESGCGKTTTARLLIGLIERDQGSIRIAGRRVGEPDGIGLKQVRRQMQMVFQDSFASLNPRMTVGQAIEHPAQIHLPNMPPEERKRMVFELLEAVGMSPPDFFYNKYPHQVSGGQRQRIVLAREIGRAHV